MLVCTDSGTFALSRRPLNFMNDILRSIEIKLRQGNPIDSQWPTSRSTILVDGLGNIHRGGVRGEEGVGGGSVVVGESKGFLAFRLG